MTKKFSLIGVAKVGLSENGTGHWWLQRLSSVISIPLSYWLLVFLDFCVNADFKQTQDWLASPVNAGALALWVVIVCLHAALGLQVVIEDYIPRPKLQVLSIRGVQLLMSGVALSLIYALILPV